MGKVFTKDTLKLSLVIFVVAVISIMFYSWICNGVTINIFERLIGRHCVRNVIYPPTAYVISFFIYGAVFSFIVSILIEKMKEAKNLKKLILLLLPILLILFVLFYYGISDCMKCGNRFSDEGLNYGPRYYKTYKCNSTEDCVYGSGRSLGYVAPSGCINKKYLVSKWDKAPSVIKKDGKEFVECKCIEGKCEGIYEEIDLERYKEDKKYCENNSDCLCLQFCGCYNFYWDWYSTSKMKSFEESNYNCTDEEFDCDYFNCECENNICTFVREWK